VLGKPPLIAGASTTICTRFNSRAAPPLPESRRQSLPHPYSPLRVPTFFRISRNRVQASNPHLIRVLGWTFHGLVDPLCGTSWDKWNWDKLHRGYRACPGTRKGLQRGYMTCPMGQGEVSFDLSQSHLGQAVLVSLGQAQLVPICLSHWDRLCLSQWLVPVGQARYRHHPSKVSPWPSLHRALCQDTCFLSGVKKRDFTNQKSKISGRYDEFERLWKTL